MSSVPDTDKRQYGYSRDKRSDCRQVVIALIVTPEGFPLSHEVLSGNTADSTTLSGFLARIEQRYGKANRIWVMDRGIPTEESLAQMRRMGASYLVGTPKGRLTKLEQDFLSQPWQRVRDGVEVKRLDGDEDICPPPMGARSCCRDTLSPRPITACCSICFA
jgi:hypothetical protein